MIGMFIPLLTTTQRWNANEPDKSRSCTRNVPTSIHSHRLNLRRQSGFSFAQASVALEVEHCTRLTAPILLCHV